MIEHLGQIDYIQVRSNICKRLWSMVVFLRDDPDAKMHPEVQKFDDEVGSEGAPLLQCEA